MFEIIPNWHPVFVHYPIALSHAAFLGFFFALLTYTKKYKNELYTFSKWSLWSAGAFSIITLLTGLQAYNTVQHDDLSHQAMTLHMYWAIPTVMSIIICSCLSFLFRDRWGIKAKFTSFIMLFLLAILTTVTAWHGAELVFRYGIGVISLPKTDDHLHGLGMPHEHHDSDVDQISKQNHEKIMEQHHDEMSNKLHNNQKNDVLTLHKKDIITNTDPKLEEGHHHDDGDDHHHSH